MSMSVWKVGGRLTPWFACRGFGRYFATSTSNDGGREKERVGTTQQKKDAKGTGVDVKTEAEGKSHVQTPSPPPPPLRGKILVMGGGGYIGGAVCQEAIRRGLEVMAMTRSGRPKKKSAPWMDKVEWIKADALEAGSYDKPLAASQSVVSCIGAFGSPTYMEKICGQANVQAAREAAKAGVGRFVFISARQYKLIEKAGPMRGYFAGKRAAEKEIQTLFPGQNVIIRPSFVYGTRQVGMIKVPLQIVGVPLNFILSFAPMKLLARIPILDLLLARPISLEKVAKNAVRSAIGEQTKEILEVEDMEHTW